MGCEELRGFFCIYPRKFSYNFLNSNNTKDNKIMKSNFPQKMFKKRSELAAETKLLLPSRHLLVQSKQGKQQNDVWKLFKVNNKDTRTTSVRSFWSLLLIVNRFYIVNNGWKFHQLKLWKTISYNSFSKLRSISTINLEAKLKQIFQFHICQCYGNALILNRFYINIK